MDQWLDYVPEIKSLRESDAFEIYLTAVRPEVEGWTTHHGLDPDLLTEIEWLRAQDALHDAVDGFTFGVSIDEAPGDGVQKALACLEGTGSKPLMHVPSVGMYWSTKHNNTLSEDEEITRTAETVFLARSRRDICFVIDNFVEIDRGYCVCQGLVDRFYNPKSGSRVVTGLNALMPPDLTITHRYETNTHILLVGENTSYRATLICRRFNDAKAATPNVDTDTFFDSAGICTSLTTGDQQETTLRELLENKESQSGAAPRFFIQQKR